MITYDIRTWGCEECGYKQDFDPTAEAMEEIFNQDKKFKASNVKENECPACVLRGIKDIPLVKITDPEKKSKHNHLEQSDVDVLSADLVAEPVRKVPTGRKLYKKAKGQDDPDVLEEVEEERDETAEEKTARIADEISSLKVKTPEEIAAQRAKYEDK